MLAVVIATTIPGRLQVGRFACLQPVGTPVVKQQPLVRPCGRRSSVALRSAPRCLGGPLG